jgi:pimeloyl-ACP methyl ester carboxylesterase
MVRVRSTASQLLVVLVSTSLAMAVLWTGTAHAASSADGTCQDVVLPVALAQGSRAGQSLAGTLCQPLTWAPGPHTVDALSSGATYNRSYWDWPQDPSLYSYVDKTLQAGRATFAYDRLGTGASSHPLSADLTIPSDAYVLHQIITWLNGQGYTRIDSIGHSLGSIIAIQEAATYHDVTALVPTGLLHTPDPGYANLSSFLYAAILDPAFAGLGLDPGYLTTIPGTRQVLHSSATDPAVISYDEQHKDLVASTEFDTAVTTVDTPAPQNVSDQITAPVLLVTGEEDALLCVGRVPDCTDPAAVRASELPYYQSAPSLDVFMVPGAGHDLTAEPSADQTFAAINQWIGTH